MIKGLEALKRLMANYYEMCQDLGNNDDQYQRCNLTSERAIIENELKEREQYKDFVQEICNYLGLDNLSPYNDLKEIEKQIKTIADNSHWFVVKQDQKKLKALEIIKEKKVDVNMFLCSQTLKEYTYYISLNDDLCDYGQLTQEEYGLLKEVLGDE